MAKWIFRIAAIYGFLSLTPLYFVEHLIEPPLSNPEQYYGLIGVSLAWQLAFLIISTDPARYRLLMLPSIVEKVTWVGAVALLFLAGRVPATTFYISLADGLFAILFLLAFLRTPQVRLQPAG